MAGTKSVGRLRAALLLGLIALLLPAGTSATGGPATADVLEVRFTGGIGIRGSDPNLRAATLDGLSRTEALLERIDALAAEPLIGPGSQADATELAGEARAASGNDSVDMANWYRIDVPAGTANRALTELSSSPLVLHATRAPEPAPLPATPDYEPLQRYLGPAPVGVGSGFSLDEPRARGAGVTIVDLEYYWTLTHEDLGLPPSADLGLPAPGTDVPSFPQYTSFDDEHGTAVLGEMVGRDNGFGVTGGVPEADMRVITPFHWTDVSANPFSDYNPAAALNFLAGILEPGDVVLIEQQTPLTLSGTDFVPLEWLQSAFDAIRQLTNLGIVVVETGGNGYQDLDAPDKLGRFDRDVRDSGAIIVGAGDPFTREAMDFSSRGSRIDLQGPGYGIATTGFDGDLQGSGPGQRNIRYTSQFNGTSGAAPIVVNAVVAVQSYLEATGQGPWDAERIGNLLKDTATPQGNPGAGKVGGLPDIEAALRRVEVDPPRPVATLSGGDLRITADDGWGSGVDSIEYRRDGGPWTLYTAPVPIGATGSFGFRATDPNGNASDEQTIVVRCLATDVTLASAVDLGRRTRLVGAVDPSLSGGRVVVRLNGARAGSATVRADGTIDTRVRAPKKRGVRTRGRYRLVVDGRRSNSLRASATARVLALRRLPDGSWLVEAKLSGVRKRGTALLRGRPICGGSVTSLRVRHDRRGVFRARIEPGEAARILTVSKGARKARLPAVVPAARFAGLR